MIKENNIEANGNVTDLKDMYISPAEIRLKGVLEEDEVQKALRRCFPVPNVVTVKKLRNPYMNEDTKDTTQKIEVMGGTTLEDAVSFEMTLLNTELDPVAAVNKKYRLVDYKFDLIANMSGGKFTGYAAKGLKLMVTRLEEVK